MDGRYYVRVLLVCERGVLCVGDYSSHVYKCTHPLYTIGTKRPKKSGRIVASRISYLEGVVRRVSRSLRGRTRALSESARALSESETVSH